MKDGGVVALAVLLMLFLRDFRRELLPVLNETRSILWALLERERARAEHHAAKAAHQGGVAQPAPPPIPVPSIPRPPPQYGPSDASGYRELVPPTPAYATFEDGETPPLGIVTLPPMPPAPSSSSQRRTPAGGSPTHYSHVRPTTKGGGG